MSAAKAHSPLAFVVQPWKVRALPTVALTLNFEAATETIEMRSRFFAVLRSPAFRRNAPTMGRTARLMDSCKVRQFADVHHGHLPVIDRGFKVSGVGPVSPASHILPRLTNLC